MSKTLGEPAKIKLSYNGETRKVSSVQSYNELYDIICQIFSLKANNFIIKYPDEEDLIKIDNQESYLVAIDDFDKSQKISVKFIVEDIQDCVDYSIISQKEVNNYTEQKSKPKIPRLNFEKVIQQDSKEFAEEFKKEYDEISNPWKAEIEKKATENKEVQEKS